LLLLPFSAIPASLAPGASARPTARTTARAVQRGQCDSAGRVRAWDYTSYTQPGWPVTAPGQALFDPLWGTDDPTAGTWFGQQALQLAQLASPALPGS